MKKQVSEPEVAEPVEASKGRLKQISFPRHHQEMRTHPHHLGLRFGDTDNVKEAFTAGLIIPFLGKMRREPDAALNGNSFLHRESRFSNFRFHLLRSGEIRFRDEPWVFRRPDMVARGHLTLDHVEKHGVVEEFHK